jgi:hypothetical protein
MLMVCLSVVVSEFHVVSLAIAPDETDPPLVVDPDAVLALTIPAQRLEAIAWYDAQFVKALRRVDHLKLPPRPRNDPAVDAPDVPPLEQRPGARVSEAPDHAW